MPYSQNSVKNRIHLKFLGAKSFLSFSLLGHWAAIIFLGFVKRGKIKNSIPLAKPEYTGCTQQVTRNSQGEDPLQDSTVQNTGFFQPQQTIGINLCQKVIWDL